MQQQQAEIVFEDRSYQRSIIERCIEKNSIVYLPTGAGKTFIAIQVIKHFSRDLELKYSEGGKRSIFLVNTVCLAKQQSECIQSQLPLNVELLIGEKNVDHWSLNDWARVLDENEVLVATADVISDAIDHAFIDLEQVNLMIFDECHHGRKDHAYARIMKQMGSQNKTRIIGLSGMLIGMDGKIKVSDVDNELKNLEAMFISTIVTIDSEDDLKKVLLCSTSATERLVSYIPTQKHMATVLVQSKLNEIRDMLNSYQFKRYVTIDPKTLRQTDSKKIKSLKQYVDDFEYHTKEIGSFGGYLSLLSSIIQMEITKRFSETNEYKEIVKMCISKFEQCVKILNNQLNCGHPELESIRGNSAHKILCLIKILSDKFSETDRVKDLQAIIFVKRRSTAKIIYHIFKAIRTSNPNFPVLADFVVGVNDELPESIDCIVNASYTNLAIERFKNKETNCIFSTSVLEEGIDLQMCNLVIHFDAPNTFREYVQSRGRARVLDESNYIVFVEESNKEKFQGKVRNWRSVNNKLQANLIGKSYDREAPTDELIEDQRSDLWNPFITPISKSKLSSNNAITTLENYASKLPKDLFTVSSLTWGREDIDGAIKAFVRMAPTSKVQGVFYSDPQVNVKIAKRHAAFKACIALYEAGELNDNLVPVDATSKVEECNADYFEHWKEYAADSKKAGTKKNKRIHDVKKPDLWIESNPRVGKVNYLHCIKVTPRFTPTNEADAVFKELYGNDNTYGILTSKKLPKMCKIRLFESCGELEIEISAPPVVVQISTEEEMRQLKNFHVTIFQDILGIWQNFMVFDDSSFIIVPLVNYSKINWELVKFAQKVDLPRKMEYDEKLKTDFSHDAYDRMTICPIYRSSDPYIVINYAEHLTPLSPFPDDKHENYREYYSQHYDITIVNTKQNLLEVRGVGKELNLFFPGCGLLGSKKKSYERTYQKEFFVPELCHNFKIPGDYRLKSKLIPSVVHRIHYLLLAEELRRSLNSNNIGKNCFEEQNFLLDVDYKDYDMREKLIMYEFNNVANPLDDETKKKFFEFLEQQMFNSNSRGLLHESKSKAFLWFEKSELPIDIDRNWLTLKEVDIDYYYRFLNKNQNFSSKLIHKKLVASPLRANLSLTDSADRKKIKLLSIDESSNCLQQKDLIKVLTTANAADVFDMERHEVLGDAFLKFAVSTYLYKKHTDWHEGYLTSLKGKIVSNRNLFYIGNNFGLSKMIKSSKYEAKNALPPAAKLPNDLKKFMDDNKNLLHKLYDVIQPSRQDIFSENNASLVDNLKLNKSCIKNSKSKNDSGIEEESDDCSLVFIDKHAVGDKIIADSVEALIGVVVDSLGIDSGLKILTFLKILPNDNYIKNLLNERIEPRNIYDDDSRMPFIEKLENIIGYKFKNPIFLIQAVTHPSCPIKTFGTYQTLEFIGDAVLDFLITSYIVEQCPNMDPGDLTDLRSALVNNATLACIVSKNGIQKFLQFENVKLTEAIEKFVEFQKANNYQVALDQIALMETEVDNCVADAVDIPKVIGDLFESIVGAVLLDSGMDLETTWEIIYNLMKKELHEFMINVPKQIVRQLYEYDGGSADPKFTEALFIEEYGMSAVGVEVTITKNGDKKRELFCGIGINRTVAKKCAAKLAIRALTAKP